MKELKILNLYACLGGNRFKWDEVHPNIKVTAVEWDEHLAELYKERFPHDKVVVGDAHEYLLNHYKEFDFIWSSPPCPTHSRVRASQRETKSFIPKYPDMKLYQEIIFLQTHFKGLFCVENVIPYYKPLIPASQRGRHLYWTNFKLPYDLGERKEGKGLMSKIKNEFQKLCDFHEYDFRRYNGKQRKDKISRNLVDYEVGKNILKIALGIKLNKPSTQSKLF